MASVMAAPLLTVRLHFSAPRAPGKGPSPRSIVADALGAKAAAAPPPSSSSSSSSSSAAAAAATAAASAADGSDQGQREAEAVAQFLAQQEALGGDTYPCYAAVSALWWERWALWAKGEAGAPRPGPFRNAELVERDANMNDLVQGVDYVWVPAEAWRALAAWHGFDVEPVFRCLNKGTPRGRSPRLKSRSSSIYEHFDLPADPPHWDARWPDLSEGVLVSDDLCAVCCRPAPKHCGRCKLTRYCGPGCQVAHWGTHRYQCGSGGGQGARRGLVGLSNLGNTCYMNATVQCLSHCWPLTRFFLSNAFKADRNLESKLGTGSRFAMAWSRLLRELWLSNSSHVTPLGMKRAIGTLPGSANQFAGFMQHDAQELLVFLLDTLHEDLNLVTNKPYFADDGNTSRPIAHQAAESLARHLKREHSFVTFLFQGQLHNTVVCPLCKYRSNTFSPFMFLPLALPHSADRVIFVVALRYQPEARGNGLRCTRTRYAVSVHPNSRCSKLKAKLAGMTGVAPEHQWLVQLQARLICEEFLDSDPVAKIPNGVEVVLFELASPDLLFDRAAASLVAGSAKTAQEEHKEDEEETTAAGGGGGETDDVREIVLMHRLASSEPEPRLVGTPWVLRFRASLTAFQVRLGVARFLRLLQGKSDLKADEADAAALREEARGLRLLMTDLEGSNLEGPGKPIEFPRSESEAVRDGPESVREHKTLFVTAEWDGLAPAAGASGRAGMYFEGEAGEVENHASAVQQLERLRRRQERSSQFRGESYSLHECLNFFSNVEQLGSGNSWTCPKCETAQQAYKMMNIIRLPEVLILSLKRFEQRPGLTSRGKISAFVDFPFEGLDMAPYLAEYGGAMEKQDTLFDLFAVTNHHGAMGYGHYTAFAARQAQPGEPTCWFEFDDSRVRQVPREAVRTSAAYVLYYKRRRAATNEAVAQK